MTRNQLWAAYCKRNPSFADDSNTVTLPVHGLRKLFEQTWDQAEKATEARDKAVNDLMSKMGM